ncbi:site-specific DNA-methyltransferase [Nocardioides sp. GCM10027113]|uniref:site-specific DNA-methyltransferase n=1 Tax=unclassified Nocardioides TaxID=2615069 RepID=UPI00361E3CE7
MVATATDERRDALRSLFPEAFTDGVLDTSAIARALEPDDNAGEERYGLTWAGKGAAQKALAVGTTATLHPDMQHSRDFDSAQNVFIEGDNLEVLRLLQRGYADKFKLIYIDPPYNTGNDFVYSDDFTQGLDAYLRFTGQVADDGSRKSSKTDTGGRRHSGWLSMMYPRLALARNLLTEDGCIFVSIDDNEAHNLRLLLDEVFGPENFIGQFVWAAGRKNDARFVSQSHEYMIAYARNVSALKDSVGKWRTRKPGLESIYATFERLKRQHQDDFEAISSSLKTWYRDLSDGDPAKRQSHYNKVDERGIYFPDNISSASGASRKYAVLHPRTGKPVAVPARGWGYTEENMRALIADGRVEFGSDETKVPTLKSYLRDREYEVPYSVFYQDGRSATKRLRALLGGDYFENPKDETVLQRIVEFATGPDDLVLDFFAGSGSFGHAVMAQNKVDGGNRRFVLVTLDEATADDSNAQKAGLETIPEITRMRLDRAGRQVHGEEAPGLRCFRLGRSNFRTWDPATVPSDEDGLGAHLSLFADHLDAASTPESIVSEVMLKEGIPLHADWRWEEFAGGQAIVVGEGTVVCLHPSITPEVIDAVEALGVSRCVMLESSFSNNDEAKSNAFYRLRDAKIAFRTI